MMKISRLPKLRLESVRKFILSFILVLLIFFAGYYLGIYGIENSTGQAVISREVPKERGDVNFNLFWTVWDSLSRDYFDKTRLNSVDMVYGAIKGMVEAVGDPYTIFLAPSENKVAEEDLSGSFEGVGIQIGFKGTRLAVIAPLPGTPAEEVGLKAGDIIVGIKDDQKGLDTGTANMTLPEAVEAIRGPAGSVVTITVLRDDTSEPISFDVTRKNIDVPSVTIEFVGEGEGVAHLRLLKFGADTGSEWEKAVSQVVKSRQVKGIVLDLRNNPGGYLQGAVDIASEFLKNGSTVVIEEEANGVRTEFKVESLGKLVNVPTVVLINQGSASASEILAGALRDVRGIKLVGEVTFGKGTIQEPRQVDGGAGLHITIARWLTPSGFWVNEKGLDPDIKIEDNTDTSEDEQLLKAIELLQKP